MARCAYCGDTEIQMTREHIFPAAISKRREENIDADPEYYLRRAAKYFEKQPVIKDVCAECNNVKLSALDSYGCCLYDRYFDHIVEKEEVIRFEYEYDKLLRWVLKVTFNSARVHQFEVSYYNRLRRYILDGGKRPSNLFLCLRLITPRKITEREKSLISSLKDVDSLEPSMLRTCQAAFESRSRWDCLARALILNAYEFSLLIVNPKAPYREAEKLVTDFRRSSEGARLLSPQATVVQIAGSNHDFIESVRYHFTYFDNTRT